ncbi:hypothetical protein AAKU64_004217 [Undibacterium sp. GrIS 1.8]|uniref:DUF4123 domain-containing protein n=1 Tax=Undibacterium sp. GrIS 1.8 TaxID=3143934 RepID=UPI003395A526
MLTHHHFQQLYLDSALASVSSTDDCTLYGLVDHAGMPGLAKKLIQSGLDWVSLFDGQPEEAALSVAPLLFVIPSDQTNLRNNQLFDWIGEHGTYTSSLSFLASPLSLQDLARGLRLRLDAVLPDEMEVMLRFFDPRILEALVSVLSDHQKQAFFSLARSWWFVDRRGQLQRIQTSFSATDFTESLAIEFPFTLTTAQEGALLDASEPDQVAQLLQSNAQEEYQALPLDQRYDFILKYSAAAKQLGIEALHELALYCAVALLQGEAFATRANWSLVLQAVKNKQISLTQAVAHIDTHTPEAA